MKIIRESLDNRYFDNVYKENPDPWNFEKSEYEKKKYAKTLESLSKISYQNALEIGCSIGVLSQKLALRCEHLLSIDINEFALESAKRRLENLSNVSLKIGSIPSELPEGLFDLIVMSEVGYYLSMDDLKLAKKQIIQRLTGNGELILVHWTHHVTDYPLSGDEVNETFLADPDLKLVYQYKTADYRLEVFSKE